METAKLKKILEDHKKWLLDEGGKKADLRHTNLSSADLSSANLSSADLRHTNLSGIKNLLNACDFLKELEPDERGVIAYKTFGDNYFPPKHWVIKKGSEITEECHPNKTLECACGVNVSTKKWQLRHGATNAWRVLIPWMSLVTVVVPYNTDGKFRCGHCVLLEEVEL